MSKRATSLVCPIDAAAGVLGHTTSFGILRDMIEGASQYGDLRRGSPKLSTVQFSKRLFAFEANGLITISGPRDDLRRCRLTLTEMGRDLEQSLTEIGRWGRRWLVDDESLRDVDPKFLVPRLRSMIRTHHLPKRRLVMQVALRDQERIILREWLMFDPTDGLTQTAQEPKGHIDLFMSADTRSLAAVWLGLRSLQDAISAEDIVMLGDRDLDLHDPAWLGIAPYIDAPTKSDPGSGSEQDDTG